MSLGLTWWISKPFWSFTLCSLFSWLFLNLWPYALDGCWSYGEKHADDWRLAASGTHTIFPICAQQSEFGKRWHSLVDFCLKFIVMDLTPFFDDFAEQSNGKHWGQHKIFGRKNLKPWISEQATIISVLCKSRARRRHRGWFFYGWVHKIFP